MYLGDSPGLVSTTEFNKQGDRLAFAQLSDIYDSNSYSNQEVKTGGSWLDGKPIFKGCWFLEDNFGEYTIADITNLGTIIDIKGRQKMFSEENDEEYFVNIQYVKNFSNKVGTLEIKRDGTLLISNLILPQGDEFRYGDPDSFCVIEYTRSV